MRAAGPPKSANSLFFHRYFVYMKQLFRSRTNKMLGGVCGGLGEHIDVDPTAIRLVWVVVTLLSLGTGIIVYLAAWIIIPESPEESPQQTPPAA